MKSRGLGSMISFNHSRYRQRFGKLKTALTVLNDISFENCDDIRHVFTTLDYIASSGDIQTFIPMYSQVSDSGFSHLCFNTFPTWHFLNSLSHCFLLLIGEKHIQYMGF